MTRRSLGKQTQVPSPTPHSYRAPTVPSGRQWGSGLALPPRPTPTGLLSSRVEGSGVPASPVTARLDSLGSHPGSHRSIVVAPLTVGVAFPLIRSLFEYASPGRVTEELLQCCATSPPEVASWSACRFAARSRSNMQEEARHSFTCTDGCSPVACTTTEVRTPFNHWLSVTAGGIGLPVSGCKLARRALRCASRPPPFQVPCNFASQTAVRPRA